MFATTFDAQTVYLVNDSPNWDTPVEVEFALLRDSQAALTKREGRRPYSLTLRVASLRYAATLQDAALRTVEGAQRDITDEPVIVPFWPAKCAWGDRASSPIGGGLMIVWKDDWSQYTIYAQGDTEPSWPGNFDHWAPALMGYLTPTDTEELHADAGNWPVEFTEASPADYALAPAAFAAPAGPQPAGYAAAPALFAFTPDFSKVTEKLSVQVRRTSVGFAREPAVTFYPQTAARTQIAHYVLQPGQDGELLRFFLDVLAPGQVFWGPGRFNVAKLSANAASSATVLNVVDTVAIRANDELAFYAGLGSITVGKVQSLTSNTITLTAALGIALVKDFHGILPLVLGRMSKPALRMTWLAVGLAQAELEWTQMPAEESIPEDETLGTTIGLLPTRCFLYEFSRTLGDNSFTDYYTNFESDLAYGGHSYTTQNIDHGEIKKGLKLDQDNLDFEGWGIAAMIAIATLRMEGPLFLSVLQGEVTLMGGVLTAVNVVSLFYGEVTEAGPLGNKIAGTAVPGGSLFDQQFPKVVYQPTCNNNLFDVACGLTQSDWQFSAAINGTPTPGYPLAFVLKTLTGVGTKAIAALSASAVGQDYFGAGWIEFGSGATWSARAILLNTAPSGGGLTVTLDDDPYPMPAANDAVVLFPGCDSLWSTCTGKFGNQNILGFPFMPAGNPSFVRGTTQKTAGKK